MSLSELVDEGYRLDAADLQGKQNQVVISNVSYQGVEEISYVLHFEGIPKRLTLNHEQWRQLAETTGSTQSRDSDRREGGRGAANRGRRNVDRDPAGDAANAPVAHAPRRVHGGLARLDHRGGNCDRGDCVEHTLPAMAGRPDRALDREAFAVDLGNRPSFWSRTRGGVVSFLADGDGACSMISFGGSFANLEDYLGGSLGTLWREETSMMRLGPFHC